MGLLKGTGKGVLGLVLRPTGGLIDLTSATFNAVQRYIYVDLRLCAIFNRVNWFSVGRRELVTLM